jgi:hypothetical protein
MRVLISALAVTLAAAAPAHAAPVVPPDGFAVFRAPCPDYPAAVGCAGVDAIWLRPGAGPFAYWHEAGHVFRLQVFSAEWLHGRFARLVKAAPDEDLEERFADEYAACAMRDLGRRFRTNRRVCAVIRRAGARVDG